MICAVREFVEYTKRSLVRPFLVEAGLGFALGVVSRLARLGVGELACTSAARLPWAATLHLTAEWRLPVSSSAAKMFGSIRTRTVRMRDSLRHGRLQNRRSFLQATSAGGAPGRCAGAGPHGQAATATKNLD